ncbi:hypothetical protein Tco_1095992 [Tanacetum coccineum]
MIANQLEVIHNFKQEGDESLYQAWERYNDMLYKCPTHDINSHQKVGCQICEGPHLDKDCPLNKEVKQVEEVRYREFGRTTPFNGNNKGRQILSKTIKKYIEEASMMQVKQDEWLKTFFHNEIIQGLKSRVTTLAKEAVTKTDKNEDCKTIFTNDGAPLYTPFYYSLEEIKYFSDNSGFSDDDEFKMLHQSLTKI